MYYTDATFYSNKKRYENLKKKENLTLLTSNIKTNQAEDELIFDYSKSISSNSNISDNSLLLMLNLLKDMQVKEIDLVGFDGFSKNMHDNFYSDEVTYDLNEDYINKINKATKETLKEYSKKIKIKSLTQTKYMED